jgi:hypothetical protein
VRVTLFCSNGVIKGQFSNHLFNLFKWKVSLTYQPKTATFKWIEQHPETGGRVTGQRRMSLPQKWQRLV